MSVIYKDGTYYGVGGGGSGDTSSVELTQAEYDALPDSEKLDGTVYFIKDAIIDNPKAAAFGFTPIGTIISVMGNQAPQNYLACNGDTYNISDYQELASYFKKQFGSENYFGGNGTTTFAVPDLRGEFLRGTGSNSHTDQGSGANVGTHQNATEIPAMYGYSGPTAQICFRYNSDAADGTFNDWVNSDSNKSSSGLAYYVGVNGTRAQSSTIKQYKYMTRPTNTSVLYCIATHNIYVDAKYDYTANEKVVGTWIDDKILYQKTIITTFSNTLNTTSYENDVAQNVDQIVSIDSIVQYIGTSSGGDAAHYSQPMPTTATSLANISKIWCEIVDSTNSCNILMYNGATAFAGKTVVITIRYTKTTN